MDAIKQLAIIGSTASGKTSLSIKVAHKTNAHILSLDSLALYKEIDIVSAKPSMKERGSIRHFGLDMIPPSENFDVSTFIKLYHEVYALCQKEGKNLIIVGGTSFYLKMLIEGISSIPKISQSTQNLCVKHIQDLEETYQWLLSLDPHYMSNIASKDSYRIEKALQLYLETSLIPTEYFRQNPPTPTITAPLPIYQIVWEREQLRKRITQRTQIMLNQGLIDEICMLEKKYTRTPNCMKSIGIKETLAYLDGKYSKKMLLEKISTNTARLAKRQTTFNNGQFKILTKGSLEELEKILLK
jgi:tRNA dimethylallyltransferase